jgi:xylose isomerase
MRTYLILKDKARQFREDGEIQTLLAEIRESTGDGPPAIYSRAAAEALTRREFDRVALASKRLPYEKLDQLTVELLMGVRH